MVPGNILHANADGSPNSRSNKTGRRNTNVSNTPNLRSSSPPPLPKSASLPLHSTRVPGSSVEHHGSQNTIRNKPVAANATSATPVSSSQTNDILRPTSPTRASQQSLHSKSSSGSLKLSGTHHAHSASTLTAPAASSPMTFSPSNASHASVPSTLSTLDSSPIIVDIVEQLHASQEDVADSRNQLALFLSGSQATNEQLQGSLNAARETKRREDAERAGAKGRLKSLEDAKRHADAAKREAEKRLRTALMTRDRVSNKVAQLGKDIDVVQKKMQSDVGKLEESAGWREEQSAKLKEGMEKSRKEIKVAEDVIAALVLRAKELEGQIQEERSVLARVEAEAAERRRARSAASGASAVPSLITHIAPSDDDANRSAVRRLEQWKPPVTSANQGSFPLTDLLTDSPSPAASHAVPSSNARSPTLSLYQRRYLAHECDTPSLLPETRSAVHHHHALSLTENDDIILVSGHGHTNSHGSSNGVLNGNGRHLSPIGSPPSITIPTGPSSISSLEEGPGSRASHSFLPNGRSHHFSPFADASPISPFTSSLIPSSLLSSLDDNGSVLHTSPTSVGMEDFSPSYSSGRQSHRNSTASLGPTLGTPFVWQRPSPVESISGQSWDDRIDNASTTPYSRASPTSADILYASPPAFGSSFGATSVDFLTRSSAALSSESLYRSDPEPVQPASKRRWFHSGSSVRSDPPSSGAGNPRPIASPSKTRKESTLNPDAKVFRFTRGRSFAFPSRSGSVEDASGIADDGDAHRDPNAIGDGRPAGSLSAGSLNNAFTSAAPPPPPSTNATSFLSSLLAFTPSAEERAALQRSLGHIPAGGTNPAWNNSVEHLGSDLSPSPTLTHDHAQSGQQGSGGSARSSHADLAGATGPIWADLYIPRNPKRHQPPRTEGDGNMPPPPVTNSVQSKRTFSSLWNRKKSSGALSMNKAPEPTASVEDI